MDRDQKNISDSLVKEAYIRGALEIRDQKLYLLTVKKAEVITRSMRTEEKKAYFASNSFANALNQTRKKDPEYKLLISGDLNDYHRTLLEKLTPLIREEIKSGNRVDLQFLQSVQRLHLPLKKAHLAEQTLRDNKPEAYLRENLQKILAEIYRLVFRYLTETELTATESDTQKNTDVVNQILKTTFSDGLNNNLLNACLPEKNLNDYLLHKVYRAFPELSLCQKLYHGKTSIKDQTEAGFSAVKNQISAEVRQHYTKNRIRKFLERNPHVRQLQDSRERSLRENQMLQRALVRAIPEHIRDLYPRARQMHRRFVIHIGPTNSGKTWESMQRLQTARHGIYLGPLRLLAFEQFEALNLADAPCSLITGEEQILVPSSRIQSSTIEMADLTVSYDIAVIDECQMISDPYRGGAWSAAILGLCADEIHLCASPDAKQLLVTMIQDCGDEYTVVHHERMAPLMVEEGGFQFPASVREGDALIVFSKARVHALAAELRQMGHKVSLIYGALPPEVRRNQAEQFRTGETSIVVSTDAIAMGMNLPISRVVFMESEKYDGDITRPLTDSEIRQIAGRAGRYGQYEIGYVNAFGFKRVISQALSRPYRPLTHAVIRFPDSLLGLPLTLTETIDKWMSLKDKDYFSKASSVRMASLAARLETSTTDKQLLYDFLCIPFDETDVDLLNQWKVFYHTEAEHKHFDVMTILPDFPDPDACRIQDLDRLESEYRLCDLCYNYSRRFLESPEKLLEAIQLRKDLISGGITHILSTQKLLMKSCSKCGRHLPWNWPYNICESCHHGYRPGSD